MDMSIPVGICACHLWCKYVVCDAIYQLWCEYADWDVSLLVRM